MNDVCCLPRIGILDLMAQPVDGRPRSPWTRLLDVPPEQTDDRVVNLDPHAGPAPGTLPPYVASWLGALDALIVTGAEPRAADLEHDPLHGLVGRILDLTRIRSTPVLFSCLAAHSALRHLHSIPRRRLPEKRVGVLAHAPTEAVGPRLARLPAPLLMPHSRWHTARRQDLEQAGVHLELALGPDDWGVAQDPDGYLFVQGHPEYSAGTLLREYFRDVSRYLQGKQPSYPTLPAGYLTLAQEEQLQAFAQLARRRGAVRVPEVTVNPLSARSWLEPGRALLADWTSQLAGTTRA